jgi:hypothetical protein
VGRLAIGLILLGGAIAVGRRQSRGIAGLGAEADEHVGALLDALETAAEDLYPPNDDAYNEPTWDHAHDPQCEAFRSTAERALEEAWEIADRDLPGARQMKLAAVQVATMAADVGCKAVEIPDWRL